jgi:hypothetical protein
MERAVAPVSQPIFLWEHRMGFEPMNTGFAGQKMAYFQ